jgi:hypothetical protein
MRRTVYSDFLVSRRLMELRLKISEELVFEIRVFSDEF